ncbi:hypothetical protein NBRC10512_006859 [Rhodotorula toruloides]|uniref:RHTO0S31e00232g1_1 n=2 Tax=Rhodotorula toruloides TaxID=5286 RepID=A0A061BI79_RHOTO|nr:uncharacterized protein RHTO_01552 [Rhodotorula toruloides NP11]EMS21492.1 hypothetical protein RHTO_01552 [Rhodotorula toruloides NP11]CDR49727.1 RHTO0S31e00232g1_1 [Rhodotorula toruloides]
MSSLHDSDTPAGVMGQLPEDVMKRETGSPDLRKPASPGGSGYTVNTSSTAHHLPAHEFVSSAKHATDAVKEQTPQGKAGKTGDEK